MSYLGLIPLTSGAMAVSPWGAAFTGALSLGEAILGGISIGSGRKEADAIAPVANSLVNGSTGRLDQIVRERDGTTNITALQNLLLEVQRLHVSYEAFLSDPRFTDGRASEQARQSMFPLMDDIEQSIQDKILALGGQISGTQLTQGYGAQYPTLRYPLQTFPYIAQPGTLPSVSPLSPLRPIAPEVVSAGFGADPMTLLLLAGLAFTFMKGRRK